MLLQFDLIIWLLKSPQTPQSLAGGLHAGGEVVREVLDSLQSEGLLNEAAALSGTSWSSIPRLSPEAKETYQPILDRTEGLRPDQVVLNTLERFVVALADRSPLPFRSNTLKLLELVPPGEESEGERLRWAVGLARASLHCAELALERAEAPHLAQALKRASTHGVEEMAMAAKLLEEYGGEVGDPQLREVVTSAQAACQAAWDQRPLTAPQPPNRASASRSPSDPDSHLLAAEKAAVAFRTLGRAQGDFEPLGEARKSILNLAG